jgi:hypothetical protein
MPSARACTTDGAAEQTTLVLGRHFSRLRFVIRSEFHLEDSGRRTEGTGHRSVTWSNVPKGGHGIGDSHTLKGAQGARSGARLQG